MPQFDPSSFPSQIFWLVIMFVLMYVLMSTVALPRVRGVVEGRAKRIDSDLAEAERLRAEAEATLHAYEAALAEAHGRANRDVTQATEAARQAADAKLRQAVTEIEARVAEATVRIVTARDAALSEVDAIATDLAGDMTAKLAGRAPDAQRVASAVAAQAAGRRAAG